MRYTGWIITAIVALALSGCNDAPKKDYVSSAACQDRGFSVGTAEFEQCVKDERNGRRMEEQRRQYEQQKQQQEDMMMQRYNR